MRTLVLSLLVLAALSGCTEETAPPSTAKLRADLITPGTWVVNGSPDHVLVWAHNEGSERLTVDWKVEFVNGTALPPEWNLTTPKAQATLEPVGTKSGRAPRFSYPDWSWTLFSINVPASVPASEHAVRLNTGHSTHPFKIKIADRTRVSHPGDSVELLYDGKFASSGERFDDGKFTTKLGSGQTVPGFDNGLMGLAKNEKATLMIPPPMGYGYDNTDPNYVKFNGQTLRFDVEIVRFA